jgi:aminoglycoside/choline kinase family phosphotransferase
MTIDTRLEQLTNWIHQDWPNATIEVASADASFRRYFRVTQDGKTSIAMDAPPEQEDCAPFVDITRRLRNAGVHAPEIIRQDFQQGFLLLEDFGNTPYLDELNAQSSDQLYADALNMLIKIQQADTQGLPEYDGALLQQEMQLMPEWFLQTHLGIVPSAEQQKIIDRTFTVISATVQQQPQVFVHRDYHSRNLMVTEFDAPGVIDYQDAVLGPITYDLVSLLRDCYIAWPAEKLKKWALDFKQDAEAAGLMATVPEATFIQWFDYMGLQRHIKVLGIFARLNHRDGKANYLNDLPLTLHYVMEVGKKYPLTRPLVDLFKAWEVPRKIGLHS